MKKLISMTDFVLEQNKETRPARETLKLINNYANFLKQPLELWMFVPCLFIGGHHVVMEEPTRYSNDEYDTIEVQLYNEAKERCLFEGFSIKYKEETDDEFGVYTLLHNGVEFVKFQKPNQMYVQPKNKVEDLVKHNIQLTKTAIKQIES